MEVRLNKRQKMKQLFAKLGIKSNLSLKSLFKPSISKKILLHYLDEIESKRPPLLDYKISNDKALLADLIFSNPDLSTKRILQMYGLTKALQIVNLRELRGMFSKHNLRSWYRIMADTREVRLPGIQMPFGVIREKIMNFKSLILKKRT